MNGAVFLIWFQSTIDATGDRHLGEFSPAEIAARQAVPSRNPLIRRLTQYLSAAVGRRTNGHILALPPAQAV